MTEMRTKEVVTYYNVCDTCGKEFTVSRGSFSQKTCYPCRGETAVEKVKKEMEHLIGAKITNIEPVQFGADAYVNQLKRIDVKLTNGKCVRFFRDSYEDEPYIDWEEQICPE